MLRFLHCLLILFFLSCTNSFADNKDISISYDAGKGNDPQPPYPTVHASSLTFDWNSYQVNVTNSTTFKPEGKVAGILGRIPSGKTIVELKTNKRTIRVQSNWTGEEPVKPPFILFYPTMHVIFYGYFKNDFNFYEYIYLNTVPVLDDEKVEQFTVNFTPKGNVTGSVFNIDNLEKNTELDLGLYLRQDGFSLPVAIQNPATVDEDKLSPLKLRKTFKDSEGESHSTAHIALVSTTDSYALKAHVQTPHGIKAWKRLSSANSIFCSDRCVNNIRQTGVVARDLTCSYKDTEDCSLYGCYNGTCCSSPKETITTFPNNVLNSSAQCGNITCDLRTYDRCKTTSYSPSGCSAQYECVKKAPSAPITPCSSIKFAGCQSPSIAVGTTLWAGCNLGSSGTSYMYTWSRFDQTIVCPRGWHVPTLAEWNAAIGKITLPSVGAGQTTDYTLQSPMDYTTYANQPWYWVNEWNKPNDYFCMYQHQLICNGSTCLNGDGVYTGSMPMCRSTPLHNTYTAPIRCVYDNPIAEGSCDSP